MKLKIENETLHFRVSKAELEELCENKSISQTTHLPGGQELNILIVPSDISSALSLKYENDSLILELQKTSAHALLNQLPSRDEIYQEQKLEHGAIKLIFDVDIRTQKNRSGGL